MFEDEMSSINLYQKSNQTWWMLPHLCQFLIYIIPFNNDNNFNYNNFNSL